MKAQFAKTLLGNGLVAVDGDIGRCKDLLLDERSWALRYLVVDTHKWLPFGRKLVISPVSVDTSKSTADTIAVKLTREQIKHSPPLADHEPVSREYEKNLYQYYGYGGYWTGPDLWGAYPHPAALATPEAKLPLDNVEGENHLRSVHELEHYRIKCGEQIVGHVTDFLMDGTCWRVDAFVVDTENWPGGDGKRLLPVRNIEGVDWSSRAINTRLTSEQVKLLQRPELQNFERV